MKTLTLGAPLLLALRECAHDGTLELVYQPEVELSTGAIVAMEGLLRWHHPELGLLAPEEFLDVAERSGDIASIGEWVLRQGAAEAARWTASAATPPHLWLNLSPTQLRDPTFPGLVASVVSEHGLAPGVLGLEISQAVLGALGSGVAATLTALRHAGVSLAMDDFGTWYSSLAAFDDLPLDAVKLDQRYVRGLGRELDVDHDGDGVVASVIRLAHARGLYVVAEGVESWTESARLMELGCDRAHGFLFASPQRADRTRWLIHQGTGWQGGVVTPDVHGSSFVPVPRLTG